MQTKTQPETSTTNTKILDYPRTTPNTTHVPSLKERCDIRNKDVIRLLEDYTYISAIEEIESIIKMIRGY